MKIVDHNKDFIFDNPRAYGPKSRIKQMIYGIADCYYQFLYRARKIQYKENNKKYNVVICAIFKNEAAYLKEWIEFHRIVGIDHFFLYNNLSEDNYREVLEPYIKNGMVDLIEWPYPQTQMKAYADFLKHHANDAKWVGFIDIDEFVVPKAYNSVYEFLQNYENTPAVLIYWRLFGSSGLTKRDIQRLVTEDFTVAWPKLDEVGKCFFNTAYELDTGYAKNTTFHHYVWGKKKNRYYPPVNISGYVCTSRQRDKLKNHEIPIQINHYFTKSYGEYLAKRSKGDVYFKVNPHDLDYFYKHEMKCTKVDHSAYKYLIKLKHVMEEA